MDGPYLKIMTFYRQNGMDSIVKKHWSIYEILQRDETDENKTVNSESYICAVVLPWFGRTYFIENPDTIWQTKPNAIA